MVVPIHFSSSGSSSNWWSEGTCYNSLFNKFSRFHLLNSHKYRFPPEIYVSPGSNMEVIRSNKVLGVIVSSDLRWSENTKYVTDRARNRIWTLRKLVNLGLPNDFILDVYIKEIRTLLEYCVPVWHGALTLTDSLKIEKIQKTVIKLLLRGNYNSYTEACKLFKIDKLFERREKLCLKFSKKEIKKPDGGIFKKYRNNKRTKRKTAKVKVAEEPKIRTTRYAKSSIPYLSKLINNNP